MTYPSNWTGDTLRGRPTSCQAPCQEDPGASSPGSHMISVSGIMQSGRPYGVGGAIVDLAAPSGGPETEDACLQPNAFLTGLPIYWQDVYNAVPSQGLTHQNFKVPLPTNSKNFYKCFDGMTSTIFGAGISYAGTGANNGAITAGMPANGPVPMHEPSFNENGFYFWGPPLDPAAVKPAHGSVPAINSNAEFGTSFSSPHVSGAAARIWRLLRDRGIEDPTLVKRLLMDTASANPYLTPSFAPEYLDRTQDNWLLHVENGTGGQLNLWAAASAATGPFFVHAGTAAGINQLELQAQRNANFIFSDRFTNVGLFPAKSAALTATANCSDEHGNLRSHPLDLAASTPSKLGPGDSATARATVASGFATAGVLTCTYDLVSQEAALSNNLVLSWKSRAPFHITVQ